MTARGSRSDAWWCQLVVGHAAGATRKRAADVARTPWGWMLSSPAAPEVWILNRAQIVPRAGGLPPEEVADDVVARHRALGLRHVAADVRSSGDAATIGPALARAGLTVAALEVLVADPAALLAGIPEPPGIVVAPAPPEEAVGLRHAGSADLPEPERSQVAEQWALVPADDVVHLLARDADGAAVGAAVVHLASLHVELDDVLAHPDRRGRGVGTALVRAAAALAAARGAEGIGLLADPGDAAAAWYRRLGLRPVGTTVTAARAGADR